MGKNIVWTQSVVLGGESTGRCKENMMTLTIYKRCVCHVCLSFSVCIGHAISVISMFMLEAS